MDFHTWSSDFRARQFSCSICSNRIICRRSDHSTWYWFAVTTLLSASGKNTCTHFKIVFVVADSLYRDIRNHYKFVSVSTVHLASECSSVHNDPILFLINSNFIAGAFYFHFLDYCCWLRSSMDKLHCWLGYCSLLPT